MVRAALGAAVIVDTRDGDARAIGEDARVPASFEVRDVFDCINDESVPCGVRLSLRQLENSYIKDYDGIAGEHPTDWPSRFADTCWMLLLAEVDGRHVGGAMIFVPPTNPAWQLVSSTNARDVLCIRSPSARTRHFRTRSN